MKVNHKNKQNNNIVPWNIRLIYIITPRIARLGLSTLLQSSHLKFFETQSILYIILYFAMTVANNQTYTVKGKEKKRKKNTQHTIYNNEHKKEKHKTH